MPLNFRLSSTARLNGSDPPVSRALPAANSVAFARLLASEPNYPVSHYFRNFSAHDSSNFCLSAFAGTMEARQEALAAENHMSKTAFLVTLLLAGLAVGAAAQNPGPN